MEGVGGRVEVGAVWDSDYYYKVAFCCRNVSQDQVWPWVHSITLRSRTLRSSCLFCFCSFFFFIKKKVFGFIAQPGDLSGQLLTDATRHMSWYLHTSRDIMST